MNMLEVWRPRSCGFKMKKKKKKKNKERGKKITFK